MINLPPKTKKYLWFGLRILGVAVVLGIILWFAVISPYLTRKEKLRFEAAATELEKLSQKIQDRSGIASKPSNSKTCNYSSAKFNKGFRSCSLNIKLHYPGYSLEMSNDTLLRSSSIVGGQVYPGPGNQDQDSFVENEGFQQVFTQEFKEAGLLCNIKYEYNDTSRRLSGLGAHVDGLVVYLHCGGPARAEHYPVEE